jgi:hypothetical protein
MRVQPTDLSGVTGTKLFVVSDGDPIVPAAQTRPLFDSATEPKQWQAYPGTAHGVQIFDTAHGAELRNLLVQFVAG